MIPITVASYVRNLILSLFKPLFSGLRLCPGEWHDPSGMLAVELTCYSILGICAILTAVVVEPKIVQLPALRQTNWCRVGYIGHTLLRILISPIQQ